MDVFAPNAAGIGIACAVLSPQEVTECQEYGVLPRTEGMHCLRVADLDVIVHLAHGCATATPASTTPLGMWLGFPTLLAHTLYQAKQRRASGGIWYSIPLTLAAEALW
ncbi:hypothetical protein Hgul01_04803 [Herpetosiphon gulosus]|uniref:Uncharacterized protein n=2 Tax=Herpetosiphon gulosus TaxID=1973496 RepID=A0ABP9X6G8_9CHLR